MPTTTGSAAVEKKGDVDKPELTLADVMQSVNTTIATQSSQSDSITILNKRITEIENVVYKEKEKDREGEIDRTPKVFSKRTGRSFIFQSLRNQKKCFYYSRLIIYIVFEKRAFQGTTDVTRPPKEDLSTLWKYWCVLIAECDLDKSTLEVRNRNKPFRARLRPLSTRSNVENPMCLQEIQSALIQEETYYRLSPQRVSHLFQEDLKQVCAFCKTHPPSRPMTVEAILQILSLSNNLRIPVDAFIAFRSGPSADKSMAQFLRRLEQAFHRIPSRERAEKKAECAIEYTLQTHAGMVWNTLDQQNDAFPLHNALSIAWKTAERQQNSTIQ
ncbi:unnamed protein product [Blumeria hordei]|uniref:Uncharacterized protein n=1 Tax=Blumeria hordei TaxID=2867405 RepID=A0A383UQL0_BLUHO|nr:unnamed protein product [Blumeria hordei]